MLLSCGKARFDDVATPWAWRARFSSPALEMVHQQQYFRKLGTSSRTAAARLAVEHGLR